MKLERILARALQLAPDDRRKLAESVLDSLRVSEAGEVRDSAGEYAPSPRLPGNEPTGMKSVTVVLPDDLAKRAQAAGLLTEKRIEEILRRALTEQETGTIAGSDKSARRRRLIRQQGRLIVESIPDERPITDAELRDLMNRMEW